MKRNPSRYGWIPDLPDQRDVLGADGLAGRAQRAGLERCGDIGHAGAVLQRLAAALGRQPRVARLAPHRAHQQAQVRIAVPEHVLVSVRRAGLRRVLANLLDNALKHGSKAAVSLHRDEHLVEITVEDDGPGIPEPQREEAFRPFHRLDEGRNLQSGGSGLGLAIARDIARAHGGDIVLDQSAMGGLKATVRLPV